MQLASIPTLPENYQGEWRSDLLPVAGTNKLCISLRMSVPRQFMVLAMLHSRGQQPKTVYETKSELDSDKAVELVSVFEVSLSNDDDDADVDYGDLVQLVVHVSLNVAITTASMTAGQCPNSSMYCICRLHVSVFHINW